MIIDQGKNYTGQRMLNALVLLTIDMGNLCIYTSVYPCKLRHVWWYGKDWVKYHNWDKTNHVKGNKNWTSLFNLTVFLQLVICFKCVHNGKKFGGKGQTKVNKCRVLKLGLSAWMLRQVSVCTYLLYKLNSKRVWKKLHF